MNGDMNVSDDESMDPRRGPTKEETRIKELEDEVSRLKARLLETCEKCDEAYRSQCEDCMETMCNRCYNLSGDCCAVCLGILCDDCQIYICNCGTLCKGCANPFCRPVNGVMTFEHNC